MRTKASALIFLVSFLSCDQSPVNTGAAPVGFWQIVSPDSMVFADLPPVQVWEIREDGGFSGLRLGPTECLSMNGEWEVNHNKISITLFPHSKNSVVFTGQFEIANGRMTVNGSEEGRRTVWQRMEKTPHTIMVEQGFCRKEGTD